MHVKRETVHGVTRIIAEVVYLGDGGEQDIRNPLHDTGDHRAYADLRVTAYLDRNPDCERLYGYAVAYEPRYVNLHRAESMTHTLRRIDRGMRRLANQLGHPADFATHLTHVASVLGITRYAICHQQPRPDGSHWQWLDAHGVRSWVDDQQNL